MKKIAHIFLLVQLLIGTAWAQAFVVRKIEFDGLQHISASTAQSYLPVQVGQTLEPAKTAAVVRALYQTGFFDQVSLSREGGTLIIHVTERPTIGQLKISGNSIIPTDKLTAVMKSLDVAEGRVYNPAVLEKIKQSLLNQYYQLGRYNARVDILTSPMSRNRLLVNIKISEGLVAKVRRISIIGNKVFDESTLIKQLDLSTSGLFSFLSQSDRYSEEKLELSVEKLRAYYMDHGYLRFEIKSAQAEVTPDRKSIYITIVVSEGEVYTIKSVNLQGKLIIPREKIREHIPINAGDTFSRQKILDAEKSVNKEYGESGYMFAVVNVHPMVNDKEHNVVLNFEVKPGKRAYLRYVTFSENNRTNDDVLRREIQQLEAAPVSTTKLEESKQRLQLLPFIKEVDMTVKPVPETDDKVDINYKVKEDNSAQATLKVGYSQLYGAMFGAGLNQKNFFGTGNTLGLNFNRSRVEQFYGIDYTDPYYTPDGVSRSFNFSVSRVDPGEAARVASGFTTNQYDLGVLYGIPVGQEHGVFNRVMAGVAYQNILLNLDNIHSGNVSNQVSTFVSDHGRRFDQADFKLGYSRDSRDKAIFPTRGAQNSIFLDVFAPLSHDSLKFYTANYHGKLYQPLTDEFIFVTGGDLGYGNGFQGARDFPFFKNYFAGGIDTVRGYLGYNLGPRDSNGKAFGGNILAVGSVGMIFPNYISDSLRTTAFIDAGNVYSILNNRSFGGQSTNSGPIRYSAGVEGDWLTPFGPIRLSLAKPLNHGQNGDKEEIFQFALGANF
jgi:outer membrane protein insertion porin family